MTWTYDGDPTGDRKDEVRLMVGDTDQTDPLVQDEEIAYYLTQFPPADTKPAWLAAAHVCDAIVGKFARKMDRSLGGALQQTASQQYDHYRQLAADLRALWATNGTSSQSTLGSVRPASPVLGGGGPSYLGSANGYDSPTPGGI